MVSLTLPGEILRLFEIGKYLRHTFIILMGFEEVVVENCFITVLVTYTKISIKLNADIKLPE